MPFFFHGTSGHIRCFGRGRVDQLPFRQLDSNGTARVGGGHRGVTEIVRSLESTLASMLTLLENQP